ncbi:histone-lysine N-methyltransferase SETD1B-A [Brachyhypopomus gauderio]|uniref:histone-lysine N-methyltransferase SETD1B-A n=1 Tax=Brachyhypopomus gauderio TaxID=698409 RepID=UPI0040424352
MSESGEKEEQEDNESLDSEEDRTPNWSSYKLIVDPALNVGAEKLYRYDGQYFSAPNPGLSPVDDPRDPRTTRFWTRFKDSDLPVPKFKTDEHYVGLPKEVTFSRLNDNIKDVFLADMCRKFGEIQEVEVLYNPKNKKHLGIAKVIFETVKGANAAVRSLQDTTVMGNTIRVELDPNGERRMRYFQLLVSGLFTSFTLPAAAPSWGPQSPPDRNDTNSDYDSVKYLTHGLLSSLSSSMLSGSTPFDCSTPLSMDTAYSSMHQDTPSSFWPTPQYQDTPHTSPLSHSNPGTPPQCEEPSNLSHRTDTQPPGDQSSKAFIPHLAPLLSSESQSGRQNSVQLTSHKPNMRQAAFSTQSYKSSKGTMALACQSNQTNRNPCGGHRGRTWGVKYQNAYNRRPEHRYVHRPVFNRSHHRSRPATSLVPVYPSQGTGPVQVQPHVSPTQCSSSMNKPTGCWGRNALPACNEPAIKPSIGDDQKEPSIPTPNGIGHADRHEVESCVQPLEKMLENALQTSLNRASPCNSPPPVPEKKQGHTTEMLTQDHSTVPGPEPERSSSIGSPAPDPVLSSLDSRIQMLLDGFSVAAGHCGSAPKLEGSSESGFEDVSPDPLPDSPEEEEESLSSYKHLSTIPVISTQGLKTQAPSNQTAVMKLFLRGGGTLKRCTGLGAGSGDSSPTPPVFRIPPPPVLLPPPGYPVPPPRILPQNGPGLRGFTPLPPPAPVRLTPPPPNLPVPPSTFYPPPSRSTENVGRPRQWKSPPAPLPIPTRITQGKAQPVFPPPFPIPPPPPPFPGAPQDGFRLRSLPPPNPSSVLTAVPGYRAPWPPPLLPVFDPTVPPPGYTPAHQPLHKATLEGVLAAVAEELRAIVKKDILRRMVEGVAFSAFDQWWDEKVHSAKVSVLPVESKETQKPRVLEPWQTTESLAPEDMALGPGLVLGVTLQGLGLRSALRLPSFKVKRKDTSGEDSTDAKRPRPCSPGQVFSEDAEALQAAHMVDTAAERSETHSETPVVKRRHARPLELDSEDEEEENVFFNVQEPGSRKEETYRTELPATDQEEDDDDDDKEKDETDEDRHSGVQEDEDHSDEEVISIASSSVHTDSLSSPHLDRNSTPSSRCDLRLSEESQYSLESESEEDCEGMGVDPSSDGPAQERLVDEIWISSDEDDEDDVKDEGAPRTPACSSVISLDDELEPPITPSAPLASHEDLDQVLLDASPEEELRVRVFLHGYDRQDPVTQRLSNKLQLSDPALLPSDRYSELPFPCSPSSKAFSSDEGMETQSESELMYRERPLDSPEVYGNLRPPTPTGSLAESDPDLEVRHRLSPPVAEEAEVPHTPGGGLEMEVETPVLSPAPPTPLPPPPSPTGLLRFPSPPLDLSPLHLTSSYPTYDETPRTPGSHSKHEQLPVSAAILSRDRIGMAWHGLFCPLSPSPSPRVASGVPRTPGRDIVPTSPLSDHGEVPIQRRGYWSDQPPRYTHRRRTRSASSSSCSPTSTASETLSPSPPDLVEEREFAQQRSGASSNRTAHLDAERLKKRKRWLRFKRRNGNMDLVSRSPLYLESMGVAPHFSRETSHAGAQCKTPLRGLENRTEDRFHPRRLEDHRQLECLYPWRKERTLSHGSPHLRRFSRRSKRRERLLIHAVWTKGVNTEEIGHLRTSYEHMLQQDGGCDWLTGTHWVHHPPTSIPDESQVWMDGVRRHTTGSARTEGFYIISKRDKLRYLRHTQNPLEEAAPGPQCKYGQAQLSSSSRSGSDFRAEQRRLLSSFSCDSDLLKFNQLKFRKKRLRFSRSLIHDWGLFAEEPIMADEMVIEYVGQSIRQVIADMRERKYEQEGIGSSYLFRVDQDTIIDATKCGNLARFINHSCNPNCYAKIITVEGKKKIVIYSRQPIAINEEITYDYKFPIEDEKIPCLCEADNCRGTLN